MWSSIREHQHDIKAYAWLVAIPLVYWSPFKDSVFLVIAVSFYANYIGEKSTQKAREARKEAEHNGC